MADRKPRPPKQVEVQEELHELTLDELNNLSDEEKQQVLAERQERRQEAAYAQMESMNQNPIMTITEIHDPAGNLIQKETTIGPRQSSSVELTMDSKGNIKPSVKIYHENPEEAHKQAVEIMTSIYTELHELTGE